MIGPAKMRRIDLRALVALGLSLLLAACNNGGGPTY
jgi:predicted small secreted protein